MSNIDSDFPKFGAPAKTGKVGLNMVASIVNDQLEWIFRQTHQEDDFGIDGYIDVVDEDGSVTGQSLAVQIKTGESFLSSKTSAGYVFFGESRHLNYYLNHSVPILIILCDPRNRICYWELFSVDNTEESGANWKMVIPFANRFDQAAKDSLAAIVGPAQDHSQLLRKHWAFTKALHESDEVMLIISRLHVELLIFDFFLGFFSRITSNPTTCTKLQGKVEFAIAGYENDQRELWQIPEVRKWVGIAEPLLDSWFFFLRLDDGSMHNLLLLVTCICETRQIAVNGSIQTMEIDMSSERYPIFIERNFLGLNRLTESLGIDDRNEEISNNVMKALDIDSFIERPK